MKVQRFNPESDFAPMPFEEHICLKALEMKKNNLVWRPHVGCFVWDPDKIIKPASPFPGHIYFILSLARFIDIFGTIDQSDSLQTGLAADLASGSACLPTAGRAG